MPKHPFNFKTKTMKKNDLLFEEEEEEVGRRVCVWRDIWRERERVAVRGT